MARKQRIRNIIWSRALLFSALGVCPALSIVRCYPALPALPDFTSDLAHFFHNPVRAQLNIGGAQALPNRYKVAEVSLPIVWYRLLGSGRWKWVG